MLWIRADGGEDVGAGHLMRCITISKAYEKLSKHNEKICFLCADSVSASIPISAGMEVKILNSDYRNMESELEIVERIIDKNDTIIVDSYFVTEKYLDRLSLRCRVIYMDDLADVGYNVYTVINYNAYAKELPYKALYFGKKTEFLLGSEYAPVREQFADATYILREDVKRILITAGGGNSQNIAEAIYDSIYEKYGDEFCVDIVVGRYAPGIDTLRNKAEGSDTLNLWRDVRDMAELMIKADLAITAGGSTVYELMTLGIPFICFSTAYNQDRNIAYIGRERLAYNAGMYHKDSAKVLGNIMKALDELITNKNIRIEMSANEKKCVDGKGAVRIAEYLHDYKN